jgi:uncharacterized coiled-coil DUF342 family protein
LIVRNAITNHMNDVMSEEFVKFQELESKIKNLIEERALMRKKNHELEELLKSKGLELEGANNKIRGLNEERNTIRTKVDSLIDLLQDINVQ